VVGRRTSEHGAGGSMSCVATFFHLYNEDKAGLHCTILSPNVSVYPCKTSYIIRYTKVAVASKKMLGHGRCRDSRHSQNFLPA